jgi:putative Mg2+ transporter-C (MgtC) family protein
VTAELAQAGLNLLVAACLGAVIGLERQWRQRLSGLRTNSLVALGAAIFVTYSHVAPVTRVLPPRSSQGSAFSAPA